MDDILYYNPQYRVAICKPCRYALVPAEIKTHLKTRHRDEEGLTRTRIADICRRMLVHPLQHPELVSQIQVSPAAPPIPMLQLYDDGFCCKLCPPATPYICRTTGGICLHLKAEHKWSRSRGGQTTAQQLAGGLGTMATFPIACQTFFKRGPFIRYFPVRPVLVGDNNGSGDGVGVGDSIPALSVREQIGLQLAQKRAAVDPAASVRPGQRHFSQVSTWLDTTQWIQHLEGHDRVQAAQLINMPKVTTVDTASGDVGADRAGEHHLLLLLESLERVIETARRSLLESKVNVFDQHRVNSFIPRRDSSYPLLHKLKEETYRDYKRVWKQLLTFVYRLIWQKRTPVLHCRLTPAQSTALNVVLQAVAKVAAGQDGASPDPADPDCFREVDRACLLLCIALLDHQLRGNIYDSVVVGFLAVLGINAKGSYHEAPAYTTHLSAFVKMAQLLVVQRAVLAVEEDEVDYPSEVLDEMQERFMVFGSRTPMNWALKLRCLGKSIRDTTTGLGHIIWSDDGQELSYKGFQVTMTGLKQFVTKEVTIAQAQLHEILLINPEEDREAVAPTFNLRMLYDDPSIDIPGWSFLDDQRNTALHGHEQWLLDRVTSNDWLQDEFLAGPKSSEWRRKAVDRYLAQVDAFLQRLLLLIHIVGGQPARGSELLSILCCNDVHGLRRSVFLENGLVSFVTFYHKGYSIQGSTRIIHRYLPKEVSELVVYYLWLIRPFEEQLGLLALHRPAASSKSPFLWTERDVGSVACQCSPWSSRRLHTIIKQEFSSQLDTNANIPIWRHSVIAISRRHLRQAKFKKDYDVTVGAQQTWNDSQTCHTTPLSGSIYARGIEEAPGHIASARAEYRQISRDWHSWLGFALYLSSRARPLETVGPAVVQPSPSTSATSVHKRKALQELSTINGK